MKWSIPERIIEKGRRYVTEGRVLSVNPDYEEKIWHAQVMGHELYLVDLDGTAKENDHCQCLFWQEKGYCKHTVAVELYLKQQKMSRILTENTPVQANRSAVSFHELFTQGLIEGRGLTNAVLTEKISIAYQIETVSMNPYQKEKDLLALSLKIGHPGEKQYVIKNIGEFFQAFSKSEKITVNQQYIFYLQPENFSAENQKIIRQLAQHYESQQVLLSGGFTKKGKPEKKYLLLGLFGLTDLLTEIFATQQAVLLLDSRYTGVVFSTEKPLSVTISPEKKNFLLTIDNPVTHYFANYHWAFAKGVFYLLSPRQEVILQTILNLMKKRSKNQITYPADQLSVLFAQVVPVLKECATVSVSASLEELVVQETLKTTFHLRKIKGDIRLQVDFQYGENIFSSDPTKTVEVQKNVVRQIPAEEKIIEQIQLLGYQKSAKDFRKTMPTGSQLYQFFTREIPQLQKLGIVRMGKKLRGLFLNEAKTPPKIKVTTEDSWLAVHFDIVGVQESEIRQVVAAILAKENFYETQNGEILDLTEDMQDTSATLQKLRGRWQKDGTLKIPNYQSLLVENLFSEATFDHDFKKMAEDLTKVHAFKAKLPQGLQAKLRTYQKEGFRWLKMLAHYQLGGVLADEMGLGKTVQAIAFILSQKEEKKFNAPTLIVAPASLTYNWQSECAKFAPDLTVGLAVGVKDEREKIIEQAHQFDIVITSYASLRQDAQDYEVHDFSCLILDEAQMVKNAATKTAQALRKLDIPQRFALSGTPIENNLSELWSLFAIIMPGFFPKKQLFKQLTTAEVAKMIQPFVLRREKENVLKELPAKIETNLYSSLLPEQKTVYLAYLSQMQQTLSGMDKKAFAKNRLSILAGLTRLRQICGDPRMFMEDFEGSSGKLEQLKEFLVNAKENGRRVLVFSQFTKMLTLIEDELAGLGLSHFYLRGSTPALERLNMVNEFNDGAGDVFLISLKAGGTGLNLTGADTVVLYDLWWNPAVEDQAAGRAHRIGQKKVVEVFRMIAKGTIEEKMAALQNEKRALFDEVLNGQEAKTNQLTEQDIREIFAIE